MTQLHWNTAVTPDEGAKEARALFEEIFGGPMDNVRVWSAPGRVNVIGEHVDYNGGPCLPIALPHRAYVAVRPREDRIMRLVSPQTRGEIDVVDLDTMGPKGSEGEVPHWVAYLAGVAWALEQAGYGPLSGCDVALWSCVPRGGGLSSSAALECSMAVALSDLGGLDLSGSDEGRRVLVEACRRAENEVAGANTGGLDQTASLRCQADHALALDCRDMSIEQIPFDLEAAGLALLVIDTRVSHSLADGQYAKRRAASEEAARLLGVNLLVDVEDFEQVEAIEDPDIRAKARHVVGEIARTRGFVQVLTAGLLEGSRLNAAGLLMNESHDSLRDDYEVSCEELDVAVDVARAQGAFGARMTGGGFGGSAIALVAKEDMERIAEAVAAEFAQRGWEAPHFIVSQAGAPAYAH